MTNSKVLLAGATGAVGRELLQLLRTRGHFVRTLSRTQANAVAIRGLADEVVLADATRAESLAGIAKGIDVVVSCLGANVSLSMRERRSFRAVDLVANTNLLDAAKQASVPRFVYLSAHPAPGYAHTRYMQAHLEMEERIRASGLSYTFVRPTGVFTALGDLLTMARLGVGSITGDGKAKTNPIHSADVAEALYEVLAAGPPELDIGGPEVLTREGIMRVAFEAIGKTPRILRVPGGLFKIYSAMLGFIHPRLSDMLEFLTAVTTTDAIAPPRGTRQLRGWFEEQARSAEITKHPEGPH
jgi:uncharacterized protein YbjT (DUF2867 family)